MSVNRGGRSGVVAKARSRSRLLPTVAWMTSLGEGRLMLSVLSWNESAGVTGSGGSVARSAPMRAGTEMDEDRLEAARGKPGCWSKERSDAGEKAKC